MSTLTTHQAALIAGVDPRSFARWARTHGVAPLRRQRIGRSCITVWSRADIAFACAPANRAVA